MTSEIVNTTVESVSSLTPTMLQYFLKPAKYVDYLAGQYLQVIIADNTYSYSIANAPLGVNHYELHIRHGNNSPILMAMRKGSKIQIKLPFGDCYLARMHATMPIIFIAIGSGFVPIKAMLEQLLDNCDNREKKLYWGVRTQSDLYMHATILNWQNVDKKLTYYPYISQEDSLITQVIDENRANLLNYQIVMCGPFELIYKMRDALLAKGVMKENMYSDAFGFEG